MKILIDTNIVLDHLLDRVPFNESAQRIFSATEQGKLITCIGATTVTTIHYLLNKAMNAQTAQIIIEKILTLFEIAPVTRTTLTNALRLKLNDFEDAVLHEAALEVGASTIITRDKKGFHKGNIKICSPDEFVAALSLE